MTKEGYIRNKYLDDLGIQIQHYGTNWCDKTDRRWKKWKKERKKYGFDDRETWNMDNIIVEWIYSHFMMYKDVAIVNLDYHKFSWHNNDGEMIEITQNEAIDIILDECKKYLLQDIATDHVDIPFINADVWRLIGEVMPAMWW